LDDSEFNGERGARLGKRAVDLTFLTIELRIKPTAAQNVAIMTFFNERRKTDFRFILRLELGTIAKCRNC
jgi:hypothetical protein